MRINIFYLPVILLALISCGDNSTSSQYVIDAGSLLQSPDTTISVSDKILPQEKAFYDYDENLNQWYSVDFGEELYTPEWTFRKENLKRF